MSYQVVMSPRKVERAIALIDGLNIKFDAVVGTGTSGALVAPVLAYVMKVRVLLVRKPDDKNSHSSYPIVGDIDELRYGAIKYALFADDFVSSGETLRRCQTVLTERFAAGVKIAAVYEAMNDSVTLTVLRGEATDVESRYRLGNKL